MLLTAYCQGNVRKENDSYFSFPISSYLVSSLMLMRAFNCTVRAPAVPMIRPKIASRNRRAGAGVIRMVQRIEMH
jgi:hypothetical protein